jgi:hypothetical protein
VERPAETTGGGFGGGAAAALAEAGGESGQPEPGQLQQILQLLRPPGAGGGGGGFGFLQNLPFLTRPPAPVAETGDYLVSITLDGKTTSQVLRVEKLAGAAGGTGFFEER